MPSAKSPASTPATAPRSVYAGVFLLSAATLLFQVALIRIFSVSIWYHFAFLVVSVALFGIGVSGVAVSFLAPGPGDARRRAGAALGFGISALGGYLVANAIPFQPFRILQDPVQVLFFALYDVVLMLPFCFSGAAIVLVLRAYPSRAGRLYAFDLVGAAAGTLLLFAVLPLAGATGAVTLAGAMGAASCACMAVSKRLRVSALVVTALMLVPLVVPVLPDVRMDATKPVTAEIGQGARRVFSRWNALARIDVTERRGSPPMIFIDAAAATPVTPPRTREQALRDAGSVACLLRPGCTLAVIGAGGGVDIQNALAMGASSIRAIEINPIILDLVRDRYSGYMNAPYDNPRVHEVQDEGRSFIARSRDRFDVIQLTLIDTWAASVSGAYSLSENYLYTVEAFDAYLDHLSPDGMLSITRWHYELPRLAALSRAALEERGVTEPWRHVLVMRQGIRGLMLVKRSPFRAAEVDSARAWAGVHGATIEHDPVHTTGATFVEAYLAAENPREVEAQVDIAIHPVRDDSPFFFQMAKWDRIDWRALRSFGRGGILEPLSLPVAQIVLLCALALGVLLSLALLAVPLAARAVPSRRRWTWLGYFFALGLAYIIVEVVLMQRFALFLGHPTYSVTAILFAILLFSGLGAAWSDRRRGDTGSVLRPVTWALPLVIVLIAFGMPPVLRHLLGLPLAARLAIAVIAVAPAAFLMGVPFPTGIRAIGATEPRHVAWAWAANGCASVIGSVCAVLGAMVWSFSVMLLIATAIYVIALLVVSRLRVALA
ncbi:MAG TPA: hypothetical protein VF247_04165 [Candidatus Krumholzibacteria bacterium]